jgi:sugar/nucleoside kinase (ribokinase family)
MSPVNVFSQVDYLAVGHVSRDLTPAGPVAGGTVTYASQAALAMGCRTAVLTSAAADFDIDLTFPGINVKCVPAAETTTFENVYGPSGRHQTIHAIAQPLRSEDVPANWKRAHIVHLGPIANEIDPAMVNLFSNSLVGLTPQGWFRRWDENGRVYAGDWSGSETIFSLAGAVILSKEDLPDAQMLDRIRGWSPLVVLTQQAGGCTVYCRDEVRQVPAPTVGEANPTGAGDIFAAAFLIRLRQTNGNPWEAAAFANRIAAQSVTRKDLASKIEAIKDLLGNND